MSSDHAAAHALLKGAADPRAVAAARPSVSVLLSNYNHARYLPESLAAICHQTVPPDEVIVVDDGSTDDSVAVIERFASDFPFIRPLRNDRNRGLMYSIARALSEASMDYVVWAAADDRLLPHFLQRNLSVLEQYPRAGLSFSRLAVFEAGTGRVREYLGDAPSGPAFDLGGEARYLSPEALRQRLGQSYLWMSGNTVVVRRDALLEAGGFRPALAWHSEWFVFYVVALRYGACVVPETLAMMREAPATYSRGGMADARRQRQVLRALAGAIKEPALGDVAPAFRACPSLLSPFGVPMLGVLAANPRHWDLFLRYGAWTAEHWANILQGRARATGNRALLGKAKLLRAGQRLVEALTPAAWKR